MKNIYFYLILAICVCQLSAKIKVDTETGYFVDEFGRFRLFHGVNVIYKLAPYYPPILDKFDADISFSEEDAKNLT